MTAAGPVRFGISSLDVAALPLYADATGTFREAGIAATIERDLGHPAEVVAAVAEGRLDVGYADVVSTVRAIADGSPVFLLAPGGQYDAAEPIVVLAQAPAGTLRDAVDLHGKAVATPASGDLASLGIRTWVAANGGDPERIRFVSGIPMKQAAAALADGTADAFIVSEPQRTLQRAGLAELAAPFDALAPRFLMGCYVGARRWAADQPRVARRVAQSLLATARWANRHRERTAQILAERLGFDPALVAEMRRARYAEELGPELLAPVLEAAAAHGFIAPLRPDDAIARAILEAVEALKGATP